MEYLNTRPSGNLLASEGCSYLLDRFETIPEGAELIRDIADNRFSYEKRTCLRWVSSWRWVCHGRRVYPPHRRPYPPSYPGYPGGGCHRRHYTYCANWDYDTIREPGYTEAVQLSRNLDEMFAKTQNLCSYAADGRYDRAYQEAQILLEFITNDVKPSEDRVYAMACD